MLREKHPKRVVGKSQRLTEGGGLRFLLPRAQAENILQVLCQRTVLSIVTQRKLWCHTVAQKCVRETCRHVSPGLFQKTCTIKRGVQSQLQSLSLSRCPQIQRGWGWNEWGGWPWQQTHYPKLGRNRGLQHHAPKNVRFDQLHLSKDQHKRPRVKTNPAD